VTHITSNIRLARVALIATGAISIAVLVGNGNWG
jgi:hypothetical protein